MALCINTPALLCEHFQLLGIKTPDNIKHLELYLGKTIESTVEVTITNIEPKFVKRRILATTPPTDVLHRATLISTALVQIYNQVFMVLPVKPQHTEKFFSEILHFLWNKQADGRIALTRTLVAKDSNWSRNGRTRCSAPR